MSDAPSLMPRTPERTAAIPEVHAAPEFQVEQPRPAEVIPEAPSVTPAPHVTPVVPVVPVSDVPLASFQHQVEEVLSGGLADRYQAMDPATQSRFKVVGEQTASAVSLLLQATKVQVNKIVQLIVAWLKIMPGVNTFFLEQEAKIKTDRLLRLKSESAPADQKKL